MSESTAQKALDKLEVLFPSMPLKYNIRWQQVTTLGIGDTIPILAEPPDDISLASLLRYCSKNSIPTLILGGGSNIAGADKPFTGIVIRLYQNDFVKVKTGHEHVTSGAGVRLYDLLVSAAKRGIGGASALAGIPGTLGGALRMNAGANGVCISDFVLDLCGFDSKGTPWCASKEDIKWGYRSSDIPSDIIFTGIIMKMEQVKAQKELAKIRSEIAVRKKKEPAGRSAGCIFLNPTPELSAGKLIDVANCKEMYQGDLKISTQHANYFINTGNATEEESVQLAIEVRNKVFAKTGITLTPELCFANTNSLKRILSSQKSITVAVLKGGDSSERSISLESGKAVAGSLRDAGFKVMEIDMKEMEITDDMFNADIVFPVLHGGYGEDGQLQKLLEEKGITFVGCGSKACQISFDKLKSKELMKQCSIPTPKYEVLSQNSTLFPSGMTLPLVVKPPQEGSSVGISVVRSREEWKDAVETAFAYSDEIIAEEYIEGTEITVGVLDQKALPVVEIAFPGDIYDYDAKYTHSKGATAYLCPPESIDDKSQKKAQKIAVELFEACGACDLLRVDMIVDNSGNIYVIEANNMPGFTSDSLLPKAAKAEDISFTELTASLVLNALKRKSIKR